jgi:hypothetical protein
MTGSNIINIIENKKPPSKTEGGLMNVSNAIFRI